MTLHIPEWNKSCGRGLDSCEYSLRQTLFHNHFVYTDGTFMQLNFLFKQLYLVFYQTVCVTADVN